MTNTNIMYQHGTLAALVPGLFAGTLSVGALLQHGNSGIGTLSGLDGELIILGGTVYQVNATGAVHVIDDQQQVPFANVHFAAFQAAGQVATATYAGLKDALIAALGTVNLFAAVRVHGTFAQMKTRAVARQQPPYPTLTATAAAQHVFTAEQVTGTVIGYFLPPKLYAGMTSPGFHLHFLSDDHTMGGHILDLTLTQGDLAVQLFSDVQLHLPQTDAAFLATNLDSPQIIDDIRQAEN